MACSQKLPRTGQFFAPLEKCVGHSLKLFDIVLKNWAPLRNLFARLVSQAGYGPVCSVEWL